MGSSARSVAPHFLQCTEKQAVKILRDQNMYENDTNGQVRCVKYERLGVVVKRWS